MDEKIANALLKIAGAIDNLATQVKYLGGGDNASTMGAIEFLAVCVKEAGNSMSDTIENVAQAIEKIDIGK